MTDDIAYPDDDRLLAEEYALRLLNRDEEARVEERLVTDPHLSGLVAAAVNQFAALSDEVAPVTPPRRAKATLMRDLFAEPGASFWHRAGLWRLISFGTTAAAGLFALALVMQVRTGPADPPGNAPGAVYVSEIAAADDSLRLLGVYDGQSGALQLTRTAGAPLAGRVHELWAIVGDDAPVSLGVMPENGRTALTLPDGLRGALGSGIVLAISDEPPGGSPTGVPTGEVLAVGEVIDI